MRHQVRTSDWRRVRLAALSTPIMLAMAAGVFAADAGTNKADMAVAEVPNLAERLEAYTVQSSKDVPPVFLEIGKRQLDSITQSGVLTNALSEGDACPAFELPNQFGQKVKSADLVKNGPVVLVFYRGGWCPYCNLTLRTYQEALPAFEAAGATLVAVSGEPPDSSLSAIEKHELAFDVLSDPGFKVAHDFGIVYSLNSELSQLTDQFGLNLRERNGTEKHELALAATYVIDRDGTIQYAFVDADYKKRAEPADVLATLKKIQRRP